MSIPRKNILDALFSLDGKTAVVTGATGYFGQIFVNSLLEAGARVVLMGRGSKLKEATHRLQNQYEKTAVDAEAADFFDTEAYRRALSAVADRHAAIDILVNNAFEFSKETGFNDASGKIETISKAQWMRALESGVYWHALATQVFAERMAKQGSGSIINVSSMYAMVSPDPELYEDTEVFNPPSYSAAKAALLAFTRYTASFYGRHGVRCNALVPGAFPNVTGSSYNSPRNDTILERLKARTVLRRYGEPEDLKAALIFLAADGSRYMTGQSVVVDGGWTIQ